jgi:hypothetical protein
MTPNLNNLVVETRTRERYHEAENERLARQLGRATASTQPARAGIRVFVRRRLARLVPST